MLTKVLADLPYVLQYEMNLIKDSDFTDKLFKLVKLDYISNLKFNKKINLFIYLKKFF